MKLKHSYTWNTSHQLAKVAGLVLNLGTLGTGLDCCFMARVTCLVGPNQREVKSPVTICSWVQPSRYDDSFDECAGPSSWSLSSCEMVNSKLELRSFEDRPC